MNTKKLKKILKKYFIPHLENGHRPHILRLEGTLFLLSFILAAEITFLYSVLVLLPKTNFFAAIFPKILVDETNAKRYDDNISPLRINPLLEQAAKLKAQDMATKGYFAHVSPDGKSPWYWLNLVGYNFGAAGENLAVNFFESKDVADAWMNSPSHRANMLNNNFTEIGIATAQGEYQGHEAIFVVQFFGRASLIPKTIAAENNQNIIEGNLVSAKNEAVKGAETEAQEMTVQTEKIEKQNTNLQKNIPLPEIKTTENIGTKILVNPKTLMTFIYIMLATTITLALAFKLFINSHIKHPRLIVNGVALLLIIATALVLNNYLLVLQAKII